MDIETAALVEAAARFALVAGLAVDRCEAVDGLCEDAGAGGFSDASRAAEEVCMGEVVADYGVFQRGGNMGLSHNRIEGCRTVFPG